MEHPPNTFAYDIDQSKKEAIKPAAQPKAGKQDATRIPAQVISTGNKAQNAIEAKMKASEEH